MMVRLANGRVIEVDDFKGRRLIRKGRATPLAAVRAPQERAVLQRPQAMR